MIWKPFTCPGLEEGGRKFLEKVAGIYAEALPKEEGAWRALTYRCLDAKFVSERTDPGIVKDAVDQVVKVLRPLVPTDKAPAFREELERVFNNAVAIWRHMRIDDMRISVLASPPRHAEPGQDGWRTPPRLEFESSAIPANPEIERLESWCLFPRIQAESDDKRSWVLFPGYALFADSPAFARGLSERQDIEQRIEEMDLSTLSSPPASPTASRAPESTVGG